MTGAAALAAAPAWAATDPLSPLWSAWKKIHMAPTGRVIDRPQGGVSHSEGQGYGMVIAVAVGDRSAFDLMLGWTMAKLAVRPNDALLAWRWTPADGGTVADPNNATDGDIFVAWALMRAAEKFGDQRYLEIARAIASDMARECIRPCPGRPGCTLLLPGRDGFEIEGGFLINPAYYMIRALRDLADTLGLPELDRVATDGVALISELSRDRLVPDWASVTASGVQPAATKSSAYGYEAMRVPMYLYWSDLAGHSSIRQAARAYASIFAADPDSSPVVIDPSTGAVTETSTDPGYRALAALAACAHGGNTSQIMPAFRADQSYYPATLHLLALIAQRESQFGCFVR